MDDDGVLRFFDPSEAPALRRRVLEGPVARWARPVFEEHRGLKTLGIWVAQWYNDEAYDEVRTLPLFSQLDHPVFFHYDVGRRTGNPNLPNAQYEQSLYRRRFETDWSGMYWCIPLFACFAPEVDEDLGLWDAENWGLAAVFRATESGLVLDPEPVPCRAWLQGVPPTYQQDETLEDVRANMEQWLDWVEPDQIEWPQAALPDRDTIVRNFERLMELHDEAHHLSARLDRFLARGPQPFMVHGTLIPNPSPGNRESGLETRRLIEESVAAYDRLVELMPIPAAAYRS